MFAQMFADDADVSSQNVYTSWGEKKLLAYDDIRDF